MTIGKGTKSGRELRGFIEEIEGVDDRMKQLRESRAAIFARAKEQSFDVKTIRKVLSLRKQKPHERQEAEALLDTYLHAIGMAEEPPLFVALGKVGVDLAAREEAVEFLKSIVPASGEIVLRLGGLPIRVYRDADGNAHAEEVGDKPAPSIRPVADDEPTASEDPVRARVLAAADRAEAAAKAKRDREAATAP